MPFTDSRFMGEIADKQREHIALAEQMIRKYWGNEFFHSLKGDKDILNRATTLAHKIDKLEKIANFYGDDYAKSCITNGLMESVYSEKEAMFEIFEKANALSLGPRKEVLLKLDKRTLDSINCLAPKYLDRYLLIAHNEGVTRAEAVRNEGILKTYDTEYLRAYQPDSRELPKPQTFSEQLFGSLGLGK